MLAGIKIIESVWQKEKPNVTINPQKVKISLNLTSLRIAQKYEISG
jgi:hypothetical protein